MAGIYLRHSSRRGSSSLRLDGCGAHGPGYWICRCPAADIAIDVLADVLVARGRLEEAETQLDAARLRFDELLGRHLLAFADHAAEFYAGSGNDCRRAVDLARANVANRPTCRAVKQADAIAARCR